jgi:hypothetical protein
VKTTIKNYRINDKLYLANLGVDHDTGTKPKVVDPKTDHIVIIDCSGSMSSELPKIRKHLKNKLATLIGPKDTVTLIWFSGRGECGVLVESEPVADLKDLQAVHKAIDRWLAPVGLTGFKDPIELAGKEIDKLLAKSKDSKISLFFLSDGYDNQWDRKLIIQAVEKVASKCSAMTVVEYGFYADRQLLASMAEKGGGVHIFCDDFPKFEPSFDAVMQKKVVGGKRVEVSIGGDAVCGFAYAVHDGDLMAFAVEGDKIAIPEHINEIFFISPAKVGKGAVQDIAGIQPAPATLGASYDRIAAGLYGALSLYSVRMKPEVIYPLLKAWGDARFIKMFGSCFGKQLYSDFMEQARQASTAGVGRFSDGWNPNLVPPDDAFTILEMLQILTDDDEAKILFHHPAFRYSKISRGRVDVDDLLSDEERAQIEKLTEEMGKTKVASKVKEIKGQIDAIMDKKKAALQFVPDETPDGVAISGLTYNEERPNISVKVKKTGSVDLGDRIAATRGIDLAKVPKKFSTYIWRNYAVVKDGLVNIEKLPLRMATATHKLLQDKGVEMSDFAKVSDKVVEAVVNLKPLPTINRNMIKATKAKTLFELEWELTELRAEQKVLNHYRDELFPKKSEGYKLVYGEAAATWLKDQGLTDYNGWQPPHTVQAEAKDFYMGKTIEVKLAGYSSLPKVVEAKGKVKGPGLLMVKTINKVEDFLAKTKDPALREAWLVGQQKAAVAATRAAIFSKAKLIFSVIVGQIWFEEWKTLDENTLTVDTAAGPILGTALMKEIEIKV